MKELIWKIEVFNSLCLNVFKGTTRGTQSFQCLVCTIIEGLDRKLALRRVEVNFVNFLYPDRCTNTKVHTNKRFEIDTVVSLVPLATWILGPAEKDARDQRGRNLCCIFSLPNRIQLHEMNIGKEWNPQSVKGVLAETLFIGRFLILYYSLYVPGKAVVYDSIRPERWRCTALLHIHSSTLQCNSDVSLSKTIINMHIRCRGDEWDFVSF